MKKFETNKDLLLYIWLRIKTTRKWWLLPLLFLLIILSIFVSLTGSQSVLPSIYVIF